MLTLLLTSMLTLASNIQTAGASGTIYIRADGSVDPPSAPIERNGDVYTFTSDIYDSIVVERDGITINGNGHLLQGTGSGRGIDLTLRRYVTIKNTTIRSFGYGIYLFYSSNNILRNNAMADNVYNFYAFSSLYNPYLSHFLNDVDASNTVDGKPIYYWVNVHDETVPFDAGYVALVNCNGITVKDLNLVANGQGILLANTTNTRITGNNITDNFVGIQLCSSDGNTISGNHIKSTKNAVGIWLYTSSNNVISGNTITNNYLGIFLLACYSPVSLTSLSIPESSSNTLIGNVLANNTGGIAFNYFDPFESSASRFNNVVGNIITSDDGGERGISLAWTWGSNIIRENRIVGYSVGIYLQDSYNVFSRNNITNNGCGITLDYSPGNKFYHNNFINNTNQVNIMAQYAGLVHVWDDGYPSAGNYWSNYTGVDLYSGPFQNKTGSDGIGDTPHVIDANNKDNYPLMYPTLQTPWDMTGPAMWVSDRKCDIRDIATVAKLFGSTIGDGRYDRRADITGPTPMEPDGTIDIRDLSLTAIHFGETY